MPLVTIRSVYFPNHYLSLDARGITSYQEQPRGTVGVATHVQSWEIFHLESNNDGSVSFQSSQFPGVYLTLIGDGVTAGHPTDNGGGAIKAQFGAFGWEKYFIRRRGEGTTVSIESAAPEFKDLYVRLDGKDGVVNVQAGAGPYEEFEIVVVG